MKKVVVALFVHKSDPDAWELISFQQCFRVLGSHPIIVFAPKGLDLGAYRKVVPDFEVSFLNPQWQSSLYHYNKLKLSRSFYRRLSDYEYLLTYELDAFVFKDELLAWCDKGFDFIGAPWFEGFAQPSMPLTFRGVGNSGFSLRRIAALDRLIVNTGYKNIYTAPGGRLNKLKGIFLDPVIRVGSMLADNWLIQHSDGIIEDLFLHYSGHKIDPSFKVAPVAEAVKFSFEVCPDYLYNYNNQALPFGCHAWWRYDLAFWKPFIEGSGYTL